MISHQAEQTIAAMESKTWENRVAPRAILQMMKYKPGDRVRDLAAPLLVCIGEDDQETVADSTMQLAQDAPRGELRSYPCSHFEIYNEPIRQQLIRDQLAFLEEVLPSRHA